MSIVLKQESITQSLHTNYTLESTLSCIFLFWDNNLCYVAVTNSNECIPLRGMQGAEDRDVLTETAEGNDNHHNIYASRILLTSFWTKTNLFQDVHLLSRLFFKRGELTIRSWESKS